MTTTTSLKFNPANTLERSYAPGSKMFKMPAYFTEDKASGTWGIAGTIKVDPVKHFLSGGDVQAYRTSSYNYKIPAQLNQDILQVIRILPIGGSVPAVVGSIGGDDAYYRSDLPEDVPNPAQDKQERKTGYIQGSKDAMDQKPVIDVNQSNMQLSPMDVDPDPHDTESPMSGVQYNGGSYNQAPLTANTNLPVQLGMQIGTPMTTLTHEGAQARPQQARKRKHVETYSEDKRQKTDSEPQQGRKRRNSETDTGNKRQKPNAPQGSKRRNSETDTGNKRQKPNAPQGSKRRNSEKDTVNKRQKPNAAQGRKRRNSEKYSKNKKQKLDQQATKRKNYEKHPKNKRQKLTSPDGVESVEAEPNITIETSTKRKKSAPETIAIQSGSTKRKASVDPPVLVIDTRTKKTGGKKRQGADSQLAQAYLEKKKGDISPTGAHATRSKRNAKK